MEEKDKLDKDKMDFADTAPATVPDAVPSEPDGDEGGGDAVLTAIQELSQKFDKHNELLEKLLGLSEGNTGNTDVTPTPESPMGNPSSVAMQAEANLQFQVLQKQIRSLQAERDNEKSLKQLQAVCEDAGESVDDHAKLYFSFSTNADRKLYLQAIHEGKIHFSASPMTGLLASAKASLDTPKEFSETPAKEKFFKRAKAIFMKQNGEGDLLFKKQYPDPETFAKKALAMEELFPNYLGRWEGK